LSVEKEVIQQYASTKLKIVENKTAVLPEHTGKMLQTETKYVDLLIIELVLNIIDEINLEDQINIINEIDKKFCVKEVPETICSLAFKIIMDEKQLQKKILIYNKTKRFCFDENPQDNANYFVVDSKNNPISKEEPFDIATKQQADIDYMNHIKKVNAAQYCKIATLHIKNAIYYDKKIIDETVVGQKLSLNLVEQMCEAIKRADSGITCPVCDIVENQIKKTFKELENKKNNNSYGLLPYYEILDKIIYEIENQLNQQLEEKVEEFPIVKISPLKNPLLTELLSILKIIGYDKDLVIMLIQDIVKACEETKENKIDPTFCIEVVKKLKEYWEYYYSNREDNDELSAFHKYKYGKPYGPIQTDPIKLSEDFFLA
jgi:hypothetical protein